MSLELSPIHTQAAPAAIGPYSQAVSCGGFCFVSGQLGSDPKTGVISENFRTQAQQALANLQAVLAAAGATVDRVASVDVYLIDMGRFGEFNEIYAEFFGAHKPARAVVAVAALPREAQVEIRCVAAL